MTSELHRWFEASREMMLAAGQHHLASTTDTTVTPDDELLKLFDRLADKLREVALAQRKLEQSKQSIVELPDRIEGLRKEVEIIKQSMKKIIGEGV